MPENQSGRAQSEEIEIGVLRKRADFVALRGGKKSGSPSFLLAARENSAAGDRARIGLTVTKKMGNAVVRNRIRRRLREAARAVFPTHGAAGTDYVLIARPAAETRNFAVLLDDMKRALLRLRSDTK